jgi:hypothetical protein
MASSSLGRKLSLLLAATCGLACAADDVRRFPLREPVWVTRDEQTISNKPAEQKTSRYGLPLDEVLMRPISAALAVPIAGEALDVNSLDEVPNSAWFTNRIGFFAMTPAEVGRGPCADGPHLDPARGPWRIVSGKVDGANPGLIVKAPDGQRYLVKLDGTFASQRATTADVVGSRIYHAAGYNAPCNEIVYFRQNILVLDPRATTKNDHEAKVPLTQAGIDVILAAGWRRSDGLIRGVASRYISGTPIGPFKYEGVRADDPNDVIPHESRRELRGGRLFAAWLHHWDANDNNTFDTLVDVGGRKVVRHFMLDFGDCLGALWPWEQINRRIGIGRASYFDFTVAMTDLVTLGLVPRPWYHVAPPPMPDVFGYFGTEHFVPSQWRAAYGNAAFQGMTIRDALWAARIIARFSDAHIAAIVREARLDDPAAEAYLAKTLGARRDIILREYLAPHTAVDRFTLERPAAGDRQQSLCFEDLAIHANVAVPGTTTYWLQMRGGPGLARLLGWMQVRPDAEHPDRTCVPLPFGSARPSELAGANARDDDPARYTVIEISTASEPETSTAARVLLHLYDLGADRGFELVGVERPDGVSAWPRS